MKSLLILFAMIASPAAVRADWAPGALDWAKNFDAGPVSFNNPYIVMTWSAVKNDEVHNIHDHDWILPNSHFRNGGLHVGVELQKKADGSLKTAPLVICLPGIFSAYDGPAAKRTTRDFGRRGYHVIVPPNPWAEDYIHAIPEFNPGNIKEEAAIFLSLIDTAIQKVGVEHIARVEITGESYGAILAAAVLEMDQARPAPVIDGGMTLFSPPIDMNQAIVNLDLGIGRNQSIYEEKCTGIGTTIQLAESLLFQSVQAKMDERTRDCAEPLVFHSFQERLVHSVELLHQLKNIGTIPTDKAELALWEKNFRFAMVIPEFTPENAVTLKDGSASLLHWLGLLPPSALERVRILTAQDDFINQGLIWPVGGGVITSKNLMEIPWGGHTGYFLLPEFQGLLDAGFNY
jgi:hypothetical protein